jgi:hypothetical protein
MLGLVGACGTGDEDAGCGGGATSVTELFTSTKQWSAVTEAEVLDTADSGLSDRQKALAEEASAEQVALHVEEGDPLLGAPASTLLVNADDGDEALDALERGDRVYAAVTPVRSSLIIGDENGDVTFVDDCEQDRWHDQLSGFAENLGDPTTSEEDVLQHLISDTGNPSGLLADLEAYVAERE